MMPKIVDHEGELCIQSEWWTRMEEPVRYAMVWPLGAKTRGNEHLIGEAVHDNGVDGSYSIGTGFASRTIRLKDGGKTPSVACLEEPLKPPRGGPWRWNYGRWLNERTGKVRDA
jgi:hypothetical protein